MVGEERVIRLERLQLNLENPRHEEVEDRDEAMIQLLTTEQVVELARDIADLGGINPLERMGVFPVDGSGEGDDQFYATAEGNRRLCALLLLDDPESVPSSMPNRARYVRTFTSLAAKIDPIVEVPAVVFADMDEARPWLERLHNGGRDGTGRRRWTPEQQARNTGDRTNRAAMQLRDLAVALGIVAASDLARTTTTQQRFVNNTRFRQAVGLVRLEDGRLERTSCWNDFVIMLRKFMADVVSGEINSRSHNSKDQIDVYAQSLEELEGLQRRNVLQGSLEQRDDEREREDQPQSDSDSDPSGSRGAEGGGSDDDDGEAEDDSPDDDDPTGGERRAKRNRIGSNDQIIAALHRLNNEKLIDLYESLSSVRLPKHSLLAIIGCWSFLESLTRAHGRNDTTAFDSYINSQVRSLGVDSNPDASSRRLHLSWISNGGNVTKHSWQSGGYDHRQLCNAMDALAPIITAFIDDIADNPRQ